MGGNWKWPQAKADGGGDRPARYQAEHGSAGYFPQPSSKQSQLQFIATRISNDDNVNYGIGAVPVCGWRRRD